MHIHFKIHLSSFKINPLRDIVQMNVFTFFLIHRFQHKRYNFEILIKLYKIIKYLFQNIYHPLCNFYIHSSEKSQYYRIKIFIFYANKIRYKSLNRVTGFIRTKLPILSGFTFNCFNRYFTESYNLFKIGSV